MSESLRAEHSGHPQWATSSRLIKLGETIEFRLYLPEGTPSEELAVFPRYLELAEPGNDFEPGGTLSWLDGLPSETIALAFVDGWASISYTPEKPGTAWNRRYQDFILTIETVGHQRVVLDLARLGDGDETDRDYLRQALSLLWEALNGIEDQGPRINVKKAHRFIDEAQDHLERTAVT